jgi:hypothetical protein
MESSGSIERIASLYRLRLKRDCCGDWTVAGKYGHIFVIAPGRLGIVLESQSTDERFDYTLRSRKRRAIAASFVLRQEGDFESILSFDQSDELQARFAVRLIQARRIRKAVLPSDAQLQLRALFSSRARSKRARLDPKNDRSQLIGGDPREPERRLANRL